VEVQGVSPKNLHKIFHANLYTLMLFHVPNVQAIFFWGGGKTKIYSHPGIDDLGHSYIDGRRYADLVPQNYRLLIFLFLAMRAGTVSHRQ